MDWAKTRAAPIGYFGNIFFNVKGREPDGIVNDGMELDKLRRMVADELLSLEDPETGESAVERVYFREELYPGKDSPSAPDLIFPYRNYDYYSLQQIMPGSSGGIFEDLRDLPPDKKLQQYSNHKLNGISIFHGPAVNIHTA